MTNIKRLLTPIIITVIGVGLFAFETWGQTGPVTRDPDIGAGILLLGGTVVAIVGAIWLIIELTSIILHRHKSK